MPTLCHAQDQQGHHTRHRLVKMLVAGGIEERELVPQVDVHMYIHMWWKHVSASPSLRLCRLLPLWSWARPIAPHKVCIICLGTLTSQRRTSLEPSAPATNKHWYSCTHQVLVSLIKELTWWRSFLVIFLSRRPDEGLWIMSAQALHDLPHPTKFFWVCDLVWD